MTSLNLITVYEYQEELTQERPDTIDALMSPVNGFSYIQVPTFLKLSGQKKILFLILSVGGSSISSLVGKGIVNGMKENYPEIGKLQQLVNQHRLRVVLRGDLLAGNEDYIGVDFFIGTQIFSLYVADEYADLSESNQVLSVCLVLRELEAYIEAQDFLTWCNYCNIKPGNAEARQYHMDLRKIHSEIEKLIGPIDSKINNLDFELNAGAAQKLRLRR